MIKELNVTHDGYEEVSDRIEMLCKNSIELIQYARQIVAKQVIQRLSEALTRQFGRGFSSDTLENARKFYLNYKD